jgi:hypothetical protein
MYRHIFGLQSRDQLEPARASLSQPVRPQLYQQFRIRIIGQNTTGSSQSIKLVPLDIHLDQINALARFEVTVERYDIDLHSVARIFLGQIGTVIDV